MCIKKGKDVNQLTCQKGLVKCRTSDAEETHCGMLRDFQANEAKQQELGSLDHH